MARLISVRALNRSASIRVVDSDGNWVKLSTDEDTTVDLDRADNARALAHHGSIGQWVVTSGASTGGGSGATGRTAEFTVAPSNAGEFTKSTADVVLSGTNDDIAINALFSQLPAQGGEVKLLAGIVKLGTTEDSFIDVSNATGGITLAGSGRREAAKIVVPAGSQAPCAIRAQVWNNGSNTVRDLYVAFEDAAGIATHGIWMQCGEPQVYDCVVSGAAGHGIILDGAPTVAGGAPAVGTYSGTVKGCEVYVAGAGDPTVPGDCYVVTDFCENTSFQGCFASGAGSGFCSTVLTGSLTGGVAVTSLSVKPLNGNGISAGDTLIIGNTQGLREVVTASASAAPGDTTISIDSFTPSADISGDVQTYVVNWNLMKARRGFSIGAISHLVDCHPYWNYEAGLFASSRSVLVYGGEYETNGWCNLYLIGSLTPTLVATIVQGIYTYGAAAAAHIYLFGHSSASFQNNNIEGGLSTYGIYAQSVNNCVITGNVVQDAVGAVGGQSEGIELVNSNDNLVADNVVSNSITPVDGSHYAMSVWNSQRNLIANNVLAASGGAEEFSIGGGSTSTIVRGNVGYNPVGELTVAVPATGVAVAADSVDRTFYITTGAGATTVAIGSGSAITLTASALNIIRVPAGQTMTPTFENAPTWVVVGE